MNFYGHDDAHVVAASKFTILDHSPMDLPLGVQIVLLTDIFVPAPQGPIMLSTESRHMRASLL